MYQRFIWFGLTFLLLLQNAFAVGVDVLVRNQHFSNDTFYFDIYMQSTGPDNLFLGNTDLVLDFNESNFANPDLQYLSGSTVLENSSGSTTSYYDTNISPRIESDGINAYKLMIVIQMPVYSSFSSFQTRIARIDSRSLTHRIGTFFITGASALNTNPSLSWISSGIGLVTVVTHRDSTTQVKGVVNKNLVNPALQSSPTIQADALQITATTTSSMTLTWTRGNGDSVLLLMREASAVNAWPEDGLVYTADTNFGDGDKIGSSDVYVVYNGSDTAVTLSGLNSSTTYHFAVLEYSGGNGWSENYLTTNPDTVSGTSSSAYITVDIKLFLQGPFNTANSTMNTGLNSGGKLPLSQPYSGNYTGWKYAGQENVSSIPSSDIVDWVLVELRTGVNAADTLSSNGRRAGFLLKDGTIVDTSGSSPLRFYGVTADTFYLVVHHRNHLAIMSSQAVSLGSNSSQYDFSSGSNMAYGTNAMYEVKNGIFAMRSGDGNRTGNVNAIDYVIVWRSQNGQAFVYNTSLGDFNCDGNVNALDYVLQWRLNNGTATQVP